MSLPLNYKNTALCKIRTITTFLALDKNRNNWQHVIENASAFCIQLHSLFNENDYTVQSIRIVTNPFGAYLNTTSLESAKADLAFLSKLLTNLDTDTRIRFAIGEARTSQEIALLPELIKEYGDLCNVCVNIEQDEFGVLNNRKIKEAVNAVKKISTITPRGEGNFNFTINFNCPPLIPYFPASYNEQSSKNCFVIGLETPDLFVNVLKDYNQNAQEESHNKLFKAYYDSMHKALQYHVSTINKLVLNNLNKSSGFSFAGFDSSAAPSKNCSSMVEIYKQLGVAYFGASGTVEASALLTKVFKSVQGVELVGFSGLMLALTEDTGLAKGSINKDFDIRALLTYSAVCGIGLDTVPIPGDTPTHKIEAIVRDTGTMAYRLNKPLTVRLFPVPNLKAGEITVFESDDLCNCAVLAVP